ncbi:MAG TPA: Xaa-Pro peptidase family protein [bacterium]|nr:Xaa-Pro peptidase family protein [bacterium]
MDYAARVQSARRLMGEQQIDLLALAPNDDMRYLLGYVPHPDERPCYLLVDSVGSAFVVPSLNATEAAQHVTLPSFAYSDADGPAAALAAARRALGGRTPSRIAVSDTMRADFVLTLRAAYPDAGLALGSLVLAPLRMRKSAEEIELIKRSGLHADQAMRDAWGACRVGATEREISEAAAASFRRSGSEEVLFAQVASGPNGAFPHHHSGSRALRPGDAVTLDLGGRLDGYASDLTRAAFLGTPPPRYLEAHRAVEAAVVAGMAAARPGALLKDVDLAGRGEIARAGFGEYFIHRIGHGLGLTGHELPSVTHLNAQPIAEGMVFSVEPGIYIPGEFGVRLEEIVYIARDGAHRISLLPRDVHQVPAG